MRRKTRPTCLRDILWPGATKPVIPLDVHKPYTRPSLVRRLVNRWRYH